MKKPMKKQRIKQRNKYWKKLACMPLLIMLLSGCTLAQAVLPDAGEPGTVTEPETAVFQDGDIEVYSGDPYITVNENVPEFTSDEITAESFELYGELDRLGRCTQAFACVGTDLMPTEKRGNISRVKPTGWHSTRYDSVEGKNLYNRCHLIAYQLTGENANEKNLITGTRYMNADGMLPFENMVAEYVKDTGNHVMYRVTPEFEGNNLVAGGVQMEALSVEDDGEGVSFNVYIYNIQPGIEIDYATGDSWEASGEELPQAGGDGAAYVLNTNTKKFHLPSCPSAEKMQEENRENFTGDKERLAEMGYAPCGSCNP